MKAVHLSISLILFLSKTQLKEYNGQISVVMSKIDLVQLPTQPAFDNVIGINTKPCRRQTKQDPSKDPKGGFKAQRKLYSRCKGPRDAAKGGSKAQTKLTSKATEEKHGGRPGANRQVNILRLSRIAKANLQKEIEKENYRRPLPNSNENFAEVMIENTDIYEEGPDESEGTENTSCAQDDKVLGQNESHSHRKQGVISTDENSSGNETPTSDEARDCHEEPSEMEVSAAPPSASPQLETHRGREVSGAAVTHDSSKTPNSPSDVLWHVSDLSVRPVMPSRKSDKDSVPSDFGKMGKQELETLNNWIITVLSGSSAGMSEKQKFDQIPLRR